MYLFFKLIVLINIPNPDGSIMTGASNLLTIFQKNNLRNLFLMSSIPMHKFKCIPIPNPDNLFLFFGHKDKMRLRCNDTVGLSTVRIDFSRVR